MVDKVKPLKIENSVDGTQDDFVQTETNPAEDYIAAKGIAFENSDEHLIYKDGNSIKFKDTDSENTQVYSLANLRNAEHNKFQSTKTLFNEQDLTVKSAIEIIHDIVQSLNSSEAVLFEDNPAVYADSRAGEVDPSGRDGWYYKNLGEPDKVNWYYFDGSQNPVTLGQLNTLYTVATVDSSSNDTFHLAYYTVPLGDGQDSGSWFRSRQVYTPQLPFDRGVKTLFYVGDEPPADLYPTLPRVSMILSTSSSFGLNADSEYLLTTVFGTNSAASSGTIELLVNKLGILSSSYNNEYSLETEESYSISGIKSSLMTETSLRESADIALDSRVGLLENQEYNKSVITVTSGQVSAGYIDLADKAVDKSTVIFVNRVPVFEGEDYSISLNNNLTRITFINTFAPGQADALTTGDKVRVTYEKAY